MTVSSTNTFDLEAIDAFTEAFERCGVAPEKLNGALLDSGRRSLNLLFASWANRGPLQWAIDEQTQALSATTASYALPSGTVDILYAYVRDISSDDRLLGRISRSDYSSYANKDATSSSGPSVFWVDRTISPTVYIWPALATGASALTLRYYRMRALYDVTGTYTQTADVPPRWLDAICAGLAAKLAVKFAPDRLPMLQQDAAEAYRIASGEDMERVPLRLMPCWS